jgi:2-keto-4-pentenoate hydratase/2-oxohepta-3-ene-1,7-dioic acid hydratase in catechol pathway
MKYARFTHAGKTQVGIVDANASTITPLVDGSSDLSRLFSSAKDIRVPSQGASISLDQVTLLAPVIPPRNVFCVGKNYQQHAKEFAGSGFEAGAVKGAEIDEYPAVFTKPASSIVGPKAMVSLHSHMTSSVDYEAELAVVIGQGGRDIPKDKAYDHIWGYTIINDVTARDRQKNHKQWFMGKALDTFCPMGPWVVTADEVDPENLAIKCWVNGELRQDANTRDLIFDIPTLIETISAGLALLPGDVIATGTPAGVGIGFKPPRFLKANDEVSIEIAGIGTLKNLFG